MSYTDEQIYEALKSQVVNNPDGASVIDVFVGLGLYAEVQEALQRLTQAGKLKDVGRGNYLPEVTA